MHKTTLSVFAVIITALFFITSIAFCGEKTNSYEAFGLRKGSDGKLSEAKANLLKAAQQSNDPQNSTAKKLADTIDDSKSNKISYMGTIFVLRAQDAVNKGQTDKAIEEFKKAIGQDPAYAPTYSYLGNLYLSINKKSEAINAFKDCLKYAPKESTLAKETEKIIADLEK